MAGLPEYATKKELATHMKEVKKLIKDSAKKDKKLDDKTYQKKKEKSA